jgi:hypothetical protein
MTVLAVKAVRLGDVKIVHFVSLTLKYPYIRPVLVYPCYRYYSLGLMNALVVMLACANHYSLFYESP